jgi:Stress responsive A/B Barrel Domain
LITHSVIFSLKHQSGSAEEESFLQAADILTSIPGVQNFKKLRQVSSKNDYHFGFSMEFSDQAAYSFYNEHPYHVGFVQERWIPEVAKFLEIDYVSL